LKGVLDRPTDTGFMPKARYRDNVHALRTLHELKFSGEDPDDEQRHALARYVGWGGLAKALGNGYAPDWRNEQEELNQMMEEGVFTRQDRQVFSESALNAHYTAPEVVESVWRAMEHMGFKEGDVLEPAVGTGNFIGLMPDSLQPTTRVTGVEQEPISAAIARRLYPDANITRSPFEEYPIQDGSFDAVVGNIPFGNYQLHDPRYDKHRLSIHNYFLVRALDALRENGITAIITSSYTMDSKDSRARALMAERGELAGAIRLPNTAFQKIAGTRVGTDILFFRKWTSAETQQGLNDPAKASWVKLDKDQEWNPYFIAHPEKVIGEKEFVSTQFGYRHEAVLEDIEKLPELLDAAIATLPTNVTKPRTMAAGETVEDLRQQVSFASVSADDYRPGMYILEVPEGGDEDSPQVMVVDRVDTDPETGEKTVVADITDVTGKRLERLIGMIQLRDTAQELIAEQGRSEEDTPAMSELQAKLNDQYDSFVEKHGPVNSKANSRVFSDDPLCGVVLALEDYNAEQNTATKRPIFTSRVLKPSKMPETADTPLEALTISLSYLGRPSRPLIMELLEYEDTDEQWAQVRDALGDRIFFDPGARQYQSSDLYLSGNVREKLLIAKRYKGFDSDEMGRNIAALEAIQPKDLTPGDIYVQIGAPWIPLDDHKQFLMNILDIGSWESDALHLEHVADADAWSVKLGGRVKDGYSTKQARTVEWGTTKVPAEKLFEHALKRTLPTVNYPKSSPDDPTIIDKDSTLAARAKLSAIKSKFQTWIWENPDRSERLLKAYNKRFNSFVAMQPNGSHLTFPGMNPLIKLRPHQKDAIWRTVTTGNVLYAHEVGTGKAQPLDAKILTPSGWTRMGDIKVGDRVITQSGKPTRVTGVYPQGEKEIYQVVFSDGSSTECCEEHLWLTQTYRERCQAINHKRFGKSDWACAQPKVRTLAEIRDTLVSDHLGAKNHSIPMVDAVNFDERPLPLDPYTLGALLGDGSMTSNSVTISSQDPEIVDAMVLPANTELRLVKNTKCPTWALRMVKLKGYGANKEPNPVVDILKSLGLMGCNSYTKFIPSDYIFNTVENRVALLQGLMDTDGTVDRKGTSSYFHTVSKNLADGVVTLIQSLGGVVRVTQKIPTYTYKGEKRNGGLAYILCISLPGHIQPFRLDRKAAKVKPKTRNAPARYIVDILPSGKKPAQCISVDDPSRLYVTDDFIVTHNTYTMIGALMEMKRLGRSQRPFMVVKKNTLKQMESAARLLYPGARIQVMDSENMSAKNRRRFLSQFLVNEFDIAIMSYEAFEKIPLSPEEQTAFLQEEKDRLAATLFTMRANSVDKKPSFSEKAISKRLKTLETKLKRLVNREAKDDAIFFDEIKPDTLCFDESHTLKNLNVESKDNGFNSDGSQRAQDAYSKISWLYRQHGADQNLIMASGTPISNTFAEGFTLMRYAMPERFEAMMGGQPHFDRFASIFIKPETTIEIGVDGHYKERSRYSIVNIPELMGAMDFMDVRYADDLGIERPDIKRTILTTPANEVQEVFRLEIAQRAEAIKNRSVEPDEDNYLKLASDGRKAALDIRLLDPELPDFPDSKINTVIGEIVKRYEQSSDVLGTQAVFCDQGVPGGASFDLYNDMKTKLINQGIPADQIAFAHDANNDAQREQLFERINRGEIRVIIGSTEKMGTGTNMQERMVALYHLDAPSNMRPSDVEQREGRINRQGNINKEAEILTVVTADSFDLFVWQIMRFKQHMIQQVMRNDAGVRELNEDDEGASYDAIMAAATGSTLIKDKIQIDRDVDHYTALQREHANQQHRVRRESKDLRKSIEENETRIALISAIQEQKSTWIDVQRELAADFETSNPPEADEEAKGLTFDLDSGEVATVDNEAPYRPLPPEKLCGLEYEGRPIPEKERTNFVKGLREQALREMNVMSNRHVVEGLTYYGMPLKVEFMLTDDPGKPMSERLSLKPEGQAHSLSTNGFAKMKEHMGSIDLMLNKMHDAMERDQKELAQLAQTADQPFEHESTLVELLSQQMEMNEKVAEEARQFQESIKDSAGITTIAAWKEAHLDDEREDGSFKMDFEVNLDDRKHSEETLTY
jgi:N12 class adenine-specific DNA methylase